jgi:hypothetical protein
MLQRIDLQLPHVRCKLIWFDIEMTCKKNVINESQLIAQKCVTARHGCEEDEDCCKGLKCVQVAPVNNNDFFGQFFPIANKFNPSKQCTKVAKKNKKTATADEGKAGGFGAGGFDWSHFVPFKGAASTDPK